MNYKPEIAVVVCMLMKLQKTFHQFLFGFVDIEYRHTRQLELRAVTGQHNCFPLSGEEEGIVFNIDLRRDEVMGIHVRGIIH